MSKHLFTAFLIFIFINSANAQFATNVVVGAERMDQYLPALANKRVALLVNPSSLVGNTHLLDTLLSLKINVVKIFAPEHGFRGTGDAGELLNDSQDPATGLNIISLYGDHKKPTPDDLKNVDIVVYDLQDVGVRFFTYISTLQYMMEACAENNKELLILDRPDPNGWYVDGPVLEKPFTSFVGMQPIPIVYGMTPAEYAQMLNGERWLKDSEQCKLTYVACLHYDHKTLYKLPQKPSPNLPNMTAVYLYPSLCLFEGTEVSVGRGTDKPFQVIGYPSYPKGPTSFTPVSKIGAMHPLYENTLCRGYDLSIYNTGYFIKRKSIILDWLMEMYFRAPKRGVFFGDYFDKLAGTDKLRTDIQSLHPQMMIIHSWEPAIIQFKKIRSKYLLYPDFE